MNASIVVSRTSRAMKGFTIIELMMTLGVAGVLLVVGVPSMTNLMINNRLTAHTNMVVSALQYARSEALRRNSVVSVGASSSNWSSGLDVWIDVDSDGVKDATETVLRTVSSTLDGYTLKPPSSATSSPAAIRFLPTGFANTASPAIVEMCKAGKKGRVITVSLIGQVQTAEMASLCS